MFHEHHHSCAVILRLLPGFLQPGGRVAERDISPAAFTSPALLQPVVFNREIWLAFVVLMAGAYIQVKVKISVDFIEFFLWRSPTIGF